MTIEMLEDGELEKRGRRAASVSCSGVAPGYGAWISVGDQLPKEGMICLIGDDQEYHGKKRCPIRAELVDGEWFSVDDIKYMFKATHWMPLPEAP